MNEYMQPFTAAMTHAPDWHRAAVGGAWDAIGRLQCDYLVRRGLRPRHRLLDIGCGSLRGGVHFVRYLRRGHYTGIDIRPELLIAGWDELRSAGLTAKRPTLVAMDDFGFARLHERFEYAVAISLFTHLPLDAIRVCLTNVAPILTRHGRLYATYFDADHPGRYEDGTPIVTHPDRDPYHHDPATLTAIARDAGLASSVIGAWGHPRGQRMLCFMRR